MNDAIVVTGRLRWQHVRDGIVIAEGERENIITTAGKGALASLLASASAGTSLVTHMGFGSCTTAVAAGDTALTTELVGNGYARVAVTRSNPSANVRKSVV